MYKSSFSTQVCIFLRKEGLKQNSFLIKPALKFDFTSDKSWAETIVQIQKVRCALLGITVKKHSLLKMQPPILRIGGTTNSLG